MGVNLFSCMAQGGAPVTLEYLEFFSDAPWNALVTLQRGAHTSHCQGLGQGEASNYPRAHEQNNSGSFCSCPEAALPSTPTSAQLLPIGDTKELLPPDPEQSWCSKAHSGSIPSAVPSLGAELEESCPSKEPSSIPTAGPSPWCLKF